MAWTIAGVTAHVYKDDITREALIAQQNVLDATADTLTFYAAKSIHRSLAFYLLPETSGTSAKATLDTATITNADITLVSDVGSEGTFRILDFKPQRRMDTTRSNPVWDCTMELVATT